ncbi:MAG: FtsW/RodA/SpoVE family cell cycle protein [Peptoniphilaceae bacterium]
MNKNRKKLKSFDFSLLMIIIILVSFGLLAVTSAAYPLGAIYHGDGFYHGKRQLFNVILGFITMFFVATISREQLKKISLPSFLVSIVLILLLFTNLGSESGGQSRWILIPIVNIRFQPSDVLKITSIMYLAKVLEINENRMDKNETFGAILFILALAVVPVMFKDFSTAVVIGFTLFSMYFIAGIEPHHFVTLFGVGLAGMIFMVFKFGYRVKRLFGYLNPGEAVTSDNYHITQALYAIAMGGFGGVGFFHSRQKYLNVPSAHNDFIFPIICEEFGIIGAIFLVALFFLLVYRGFLIAYKAKSSYDKYVAVGITTYVGIQTIFNLGVGCGLFPVTGITLPFISYGGTSLIVTMASMGLLLRISREV